MFPHYPMYYTLYFVTELLLLCVCVCLSVCVSACACFVYFIYSVECISFEVECISFEVNGTCMCLCTMLLHPGKLVTTG